MMTASEIDALIRKSERLGAIAREVGAQIDKLLASSPVVQTSKGWVPQYETLISSDSYRRAKTLIHQVPFEEGKGRIVHYYIATPDAPLPKEVVGFVKLWVKEDTKPGEKDPAFTRDSKALPVNEHMKMAIALGVEDANSKMLGTLQLVPTANPANAQIIIAGANNTTFAGVTSGDGRIILLEKSQFTGADRQYEIRTFLHEAGHALGLAHPHHYRKDPKAPSSEMVGCARTVMAYYGKCLGNGGVPTTTWQDMDIRALQEIYPLPQKVAKTRPGAGVTP